MEFISGEPQSGKGKVLCVDDDDNVLQTIGILLTSNGYETILGRDGEEAVALFKKHGKELVAVILDLRMPKKDGLAAAREIRRESPDIPLIALSAYLCGGKEGKSLLKQCEKAGFDAYTNKPFAAEPLLAALADWVKRYAGRRNDKHDPSG
ncbi:MAG: response regulator [Verrucomicrobiota bacterium]|nr:response regulator [Verrucomicrobiota bacterium]